jgi:hypothetical protein
VTHRPILAALVAVALVSACAGDTVDLELSPGLQMRVEWLTGSPSASLPDDVERLRIVRTIDGESLDVVVSTDRFEVSETGSPFVAPPLLDNLPTGVPIEITVEGLRAGDTFAYVGHVGPLVLSAGQRVYADLKMFEMGVSAATVIGGTPSAFMHSATALPDGRVLIAGGFDQVENMADCPSGLPAGARCFALTATDDAWVFDPTTARFHPVQGGMLAARGGHTATLVPGGRVVVVGGAPSAVFALVPIEGGSDPSGYAPYFEPRLPDDSVGAHATFEIFLADENREAEDVEGDGDPGRGGFTGSADDGRVPGRLNQQRFLHAAAATTVTESDRILIVGGLGADGAETTYEVYDDRKAGGYGTYDNTGVSLTTTRVFAGALEVASGQVWIFGGGDAVGNDALAEIWTPNPTTTNGDIEPANAATSYPGAGDHPEYDLLSPSVATVGSGSHALVVGWIGPRCTAGGTMPVFGGTELCPPMGGPPRSQTIDVGTGDVVGVSTDSPHAFAGLAALDDGSVAVAGGIANLLWTRQPSIEVFTGDVSSGVATLSPTRFVMRAARAMHTTTPLRHGGMLSVGGINLSMDVTNLTLQTTAEALYLPRPQRPAGP